jgi:peptidoglycan/xylan/chitin deacetylase (PgdA/CDA1 family)
MLKNLKQATLKSLKTLGAFGVASDSRWRRRRLLILTYHGVSLNDEHEWNAGLFMPPDCFRRRMELLKQSGAAVLPLGEAIERMYAGDLPERAVALTFDDGSYDFYQQAFPVLKELGLPVTLYLTTFYSQFGGPVFDVACSYLIWKGRQQTIDLGGLANVTATLNLTSPSARGEAVASLRRFARQNKLSPEEKQELIEKLARRLKINYEEFLARRILHILTPGEVTKLAAEGVDVQLHTHRHRVPLDRELFRREIEENRESIRAMSGRTPTHFCYPSGVHHAKFLPWLKELGVRSATTCEVGYATNDCDPLLLPRILDCSTLSPIEFEGWLTGVAAALPRRRAPQATVFDYTEESAEPV